MALQGRLNSSGGLTGKLSTRSELKAQTLSYVPATKLADMADVDVSGRTDGGIMSWDASTLTFQVDHTLVGSYTVTGSLALDELSLDGSTITTVTTDGDLTLSGNGDGQVVLGGSAVIIPSGPTSTRPDASTVGTGVLRYNTTEERFEGTVGDSVLWQGLGGIIDEDRNTYITAEQSSNDDHLRFYSAGVQEGYINSDGLTVSALSVTGTTSLDSLALTTDLAIQHGGTGLSSLTGDGFFIANTAGTAVSFITGDEGDVLQFDASGVPTSTSVIDGGTF